MSQAPRPALSVATGWARLGRYQAPRAGCRARESWGRCQPWWHLPDALTVPGAGRPLGARTVLGAGSPTVSVVDPDMEALFEQFLGKAERPEVEELLPQPYHYRVRDTDQKVLCLEHGRLVAVNLQGANAAQEEHISVVPNRHLERKRCPLIVGIRGGTQALSCGIGPEPQLQLEDVGVLELFTRGAEANRFTFYKTFSGSTHTFEAAAFPGHFLSTAPRPGEALALTAQPAATAITTFYLQRK
ncbi:interleukin-36 receptor antagonist protein-like isoform X2 [Struthio camelus]|uniref:interleukin-36 receptor antagonist protein-like isoform X2 n=1 Tax=Struthio camelus TaxID=8801 RepID=UPI003603C5B2